MNIRDKTFFLPDIQSQVDARELRIDAVGVKDVRYPMPIRSHDQAVPVVATFSMTVSLPAAVKGTHMSRFIELLEAQADDLDQAGFKAMLFDMLDRMDAQSGMIEMRFPYLMRKMATVSGLRSPVSGLASMDSRIGAYVVEAENFESIHNHSAFARIVRQGATARLIRGT